MSFVWVEHDSDGGTSGASGNVLCELDSNHTLMSVWLHDGSPSAPVSGVVRSVFDLVNIGDSLALIESGALGVVAVLDGDQGLVLLLMILGSSEAGEDTLLIESNWLSFLVDLLDSGLSSGLSVGGFSFLTHSFSFVIMIIQ